MSVNYIDKSTGDLIRVAGQGKAEYGASTVRKGTFTGTDNGTGLINITVTFNTPMPDADYLVDITNVSSLENFWVSVAAKTKNGFALYLRKSTGGSSITVNGTYTAFKLYTDTEYNNLLNNAVLTSDVTDSVANGDMNPVTSNAVYDAIADITPVDTVTNGNMKPVTSNAVYDAIADITPVDAVTNGNMKPVTSNAVAFSNKAISLETLKARHSGFDLKFQTYVSNTWRDDTIESVYAIPIYESETSSEYMIFIEAWGLNTGAATDRLRFVASGGKAYIHNCTLSGMRSSDPSASVRHCMPDASNIYITGSVTGNVYNDIHGVLFLQFVN